MEEDEIIKKMNRCNSNFIARFIIFLHNYFQKNPNIKLENIFIEFTKDMRNGMKVSEITVYRTLNLFRKCGILNKIWHDGVFFVPALDSDDKPKINKYLKYALKTLNIDENEYFLKKNKKLIDFEDGGQNA